MNENFHYYTINLCKRAHVWYKKALQEKGILFKKDQYTLLPKRYYSLVEKLSQEKIYDFCFIGCFLVKDQEYKNRKWIIDFIKNRFNDSSYLQFTDENTKKTLDSFGSFDFSKSKNGFLPRINPETDFLDIDYYITLCLSKFSLCPAGDQHWSMRFFESLMCKTIPIVQRKDETFRTKEESILDYKFYYSDEENIIYREDWVNHNYELFLKYHTLEFYQSHIYKNIQGWFSFPKLYTQMVERFNDAKFIEVGSWLGKSASYMGVEIFNSQKNIKFYCVDTWLGSPEHHKMGLCDGRDLYAEFLRNIEPIKSSIIPYKMTSVEASKLFEDESIDFIFIDACHDYESVKSDLHSWFPKVKNGGVIAGHDYYENKWLGVKKAVDEFFIDKTNFSVSEMCWIYQK